MDSLFFNESVNIKKISEDGREGVFEIEGLYSGYGLTIGNALRRTLLSSLPGAAVTQIKIKGVSHEFSTIPNIVEDVIEIALNFKKIRLKLFSNEPQALMIKVKGEKEVTAADIEVNSDVEIINPDIHIATLTTKSAELEIELKVERGLGYVPVEARKFEKLAIGTIALDAFFSPVTKVNFSVENMRVGDRTDYNKLKLEIVTDGSISPSSALSKASGILCGHFEKISTVEVIENISKSSKEEKSAKKKSKKKE